MQSTINIVAVTFNTSVEDVIFWGTTIKYTKTFSMMLSLSDTILKQLLQSSVDCVLSNYVFSIELASRVITKRRLSYDKSNTRTREASSSVFWWEWNLEDTSHIICKDHGPNTLQHPPPHFVPVFPVYLKKIMNSGFSM